MKNVDITMKLPLIDLNNIEQYARCAKACGISLLHVQDKPLIKDLQNLRHMYLYVRMLLN